MKNKTDKTIFIDLANSYIMQNEQANPYYVPTASTQSHGGTSGGSVNLGAIAGAAGIGGSLGSLASGVNVGGSSTNVNTKTTFSQRIVSVPPLSILELDPMDIGFGRIVLGWGKWDYKNVYHDLYIPYFKDNEQFVGKKSGDDVYYEPKDLKRGEVINIPPIENINPLGAFITYSFDETLDSTQSMRIDFYLKQIMGVNSKIYDGKKVVDYSECPLTIF